MDEENSAAANEMSFQSNPQAVLCWPWRLIRIDDALRWIWCLCCFACLIEESISGQKLFVENSKKFLVFISRPLDINQKLWESQYDCDWKDTTGNEHLQGSKTNVREANSCHHLLLPILISKSTFIRSQQSIGDVCLTTLFKCHSSTLLRSQAIQAVDSF